MRWSSRRCEIVTVTFEDVRDCNAAGQERFQTHHRMSIIQHTHHCTVQVMTFLLFLFAMKTARVLIIPVAKLTNTAGGFVQD